jgi:ferric-dicitrate binding protein FerR (iron transport regulator)
MKSLFSKPKQALTQFFSGKMSPKEEQNLLNRASVTSRMQQEWNLQSDDISDFNQWKVWENIIAGVHVAPRRRILVRTACSIAASVTILLGIGYYWMYRKEVPQEVQLLVFETNNKERIPFTLPDSTKVWLNAGSRIEYPENFAGNRFVRLEGEAYFHVTHHASHPFTVHVAELDVTVLGTIFNVTAYQYDTEVVTTLVEGKISLQLKSDPSQQTVLAPNQQVVFNKDSREVTFASVDTELFTSWVKGYFKFEDASFEEIARHFERVYGITIRFDDESLKNLLFSGAFLYDQPIETVLGFLQKIRHFRYTIEEKKIIIYP